MDGPSQQDLGLTYQLDSRLRSYGNNEPLITTLETLNKCYSSQAQLWERQMLTRARVLDGDRVVSSEFEYFRNTLLYTPSISSKDINYIWQMHRHIWQEKSYKAEAHFDYKYTSGGLMHIEFVVQTIQLALGHLYPELLIE